MPWWSCPEAKIVPWVNKLGQALFGLEHIVQDFVELPLSKLRIHKSLSELRIAFQTVVLVNILDLFLVSFVSVPW